MNTINSTASNFGIIVKKLFIEQRKTLTILCGSYLGACVLFGIWCGYLGSAPTNDNFVIYMLMSGFAFAIAASRMFFDMSTKEGKISLLMTPGSAAGKYWPRFLAVLPGMLVLVAVGYLLYGYSDLLALGMMQDLWLSLPNPFGNANGDYASTIGILAAMFLFNESIFMYGAVAWPKRSFIKSLGIFVIIQIGLTMIATAIIKSMIHSHISIEIVNPQAFGWIVAGIVTTIAIGIMYAGFRKFKNTTVI